jgi:hypothetical protein
MGRSSEKSCRENQDSHFVTNFPKAVPFMKQWGKNFLETDRPQMTLEYRACTLRAG